EGAGAGAGFGAALAFGLAFFAALFLAATRFFFLRAGAAFFPDLRFLVFDFAFFAFFAMIASRSFAASLLSLCRRDGRGPRTGPPLPGERLGFGASGRPVDQLDCVDDRDHCTRSDLHHAAEVAGSDHVGLELFDIADFALAQPPRKLRLENIVRAGRTTVQMSFRYIFHDESHLAKQFFRSGYNFLTVLKRA